MKFILTGLFMIGICSITTPLLADTPDTVPTLPKSSKAAADLTTTTDSEAIRQQQNFQKKYPLKVVRIIGTSISKEKELLKLFGEYSGKEVSYEDMVKAGGRLSAYFEERGHNVIVSMPQQDISDGIILFFVAEDKNNTITSSESNKKSLWQQLVTNSSHNGPLTRALSGKLSYGAYYLIKPSLSVSEEFNDNIKETKEQHKSDLITTISPAISLNYSAYRWNWSFSYSPTYHHFLHNTTEDLLTNNATIAGNMRLINNFLFMDISDTYRRTSIDTNRESPYVNQTDINELTISPRIEYFLTPSLLAIGSYSYSNRTTPGSNLMNNQSHTIQFKMNKEMPTNSVFMEINASKIESGDNTNYFRILHFVGINQNFTAGSSASIQGGYSLLHLNTGESSISPYWGIVLKHNWKMYTFNLNSGIFYDTVLGINISDTRFVTSLITKEFPRGLIKIAAKYSQTKNTQLNTTERQWYNTTIDVKYLLTRQATVTASVGSDKYIKDKEYHNTLALGVNYQLFYDLSLTASYGRFVSSDYIFAPTGTSKVNRISLSITKSF